VDVALSPDGATVVYSAPDNGVDVADAATGRVLWHHPDEGEVRGPGTFTADGKYLCWPADPGTAGGGATVRVFDAATGATAGEFTSAAGRTVQVHGFTPERAVAGGGSWGNRARS